MYALAHCLGGPPIVRVVRQRPATRRQRAKHWFVLASFQTVNARGLSDEKTIECAELVSRDSVYAVPVQETRRQTISEEVSFHCILFVGSGFARTGVGRGTRGVGMFLSKLEQVHFDAGGRVVHRSNSGRVITVRPQDQVS